MREYKCRCVVNGGEVRDSKGDIFNPKEFYTVPAGLDLVRHLNARALALEAESRLMLRESRRLRFQRRSDSRRFVEKFRERMLS